MCGRCLERGPGGDDHGLIDQQDYFQPEFLQLHWPEHEAIRGVPGGAGRMRKLSAFGMTVIEEAVDWEEGWRAIPIVCDTVYRFAGTRVTYSSAGNTD